MEWALVATVLAGALALWLEGRRRVGLGRIPDTVDGFLAAAAEAEIGPGELFGEAPGVRFPGPRARTWAYGVLHAEGVDADADPAYAARLLMDAEPHLTKPQAEALIRLML